MKTFLILAIFFCLAIPCHADTTQILIGWDGIKDHPPDADYRVGLALSGGGARGLAQIGVLKALEESNIAVGAIAGTSMGGIIGGLYASGYSADSLQTIIRGINFPALFSDRPTRTSLFLTQRSEKERYLVSIRFNGFRPFIPQALTAGQKLTDLVSSLTLKANYISGGSFSAMKIPYRAVTTDIVSGNEVIIEDGNLSDAMRATMAFPLAFTGVEEGDMILMDGGMVNPIPADVVRGIKNAADIVIAVNTTSTLLSRDKIRDPIDIANQVTSIMTQDKRDWGLFTSDLVITPDISEFSASDFGKSDQLIERGYRAGMATVPEIRSKLNALYFRDSIYVSDVAMTDSISNASNDSAFKSGELIPQGELKRIAVQLYNRLNLLSISIDVISDSAREGQPASAILKISAMPKPRLDFSKIRIMGNSIFSDSTITGILKNDSGLVSAKDIVDFSDSLKKLYASKGYDLAHLRRFDYSPAEKLIVVDIDEAIVEKIRITGNVRTKGWLIKSNFPLQEGKPFNSQALTRGVSNIYATGLFDRVSIDLGRGESGAIVKINVEERKYTQMRLGWHWDDEYDSEEFVELLDDNLFGAGQEYLMHARYSPRRQKYEMSIKADRFFSTYLTYRMRAYYHILDRRVYDSAGNSMDPVKEDRRGIEFLLGQQISRFGTVSGEVRWEEIRSKSRSEGYIENLKLRALTFRSVVETINRYPFPTEGKKHYFYVEFTSDILGGQTKYTKVFSSIESYFPLTSYLNFHPKVSIGWTDTKYGIPISEKFYLGGEYTFSGFRTDELVNDKMVLGNMELRYKLPYRFYIIGRYDTGEIYSSVQQIKLGKLRHGFGFSIAYDSPLGPIDLGYGKAQHHSACYYVNIGLAF